MLPSVPPLIIKGPGTDDVIAGEGVLPDKLTDTVTEAGTEIAMQEADAVAVISATLRVESLLIWLVRFCKTTPSESPSCIV